MSVASALARGRAKAESRMTSRCTVMRKTGDTTTNGAGLEVPEWAAVYTDLPTRVHTDPRAAASQSETIGNVTDAAAVRVESFPRGTVLRDDDLVLITAGENDDEVFRVSDATPSDQQTALRVKVTATRRPTEWDA